MRLVVLSIISAPHAALYASIACTFRIEEPGREVQRKYLSIEGYPPARSRKSANFTPSLWFSADR